MSVVSVRESEVRWGQKARANCGILGDDVGLFLLTHYQLTRGLCLLLLVFVCFWGVGSGWGVGGGEAGG